MFYKLDDSSSYPTALTISYKDNKIYYGESNSIKILNFKVDAVDHRYFKLEK